MSQGLYREIHPSHPPIQYCTLLKHFELKKTILSERNALLYNKCTLEMHFLYKRLGSSEVKNETV